ncbi:hypothetical protein GGR92_000469 [Spirosoma lacussanchae]
MVRSSYASVVLLLLIIPILYGLWMRLSPHSPPNTWIVYFAILFSGPLLLVYGVVMRFMLYEKKLSSIALLIGCLLVEAEIIFVIETLLHNNT